MGTAQIGPGHAMSARIIVNLEPRPVIDGRWHLVPPLPRIPQTGESITTLCGRTEQVEYVSAECANHTVAPVLTCWHCDYAYRQREALTISADHPALPRQRGIDA